MLELYLLRHARAKRANGKLRDADRPLSRRGRCQAAAMAPALARRGAFDGEVLVVGHNPALLELARWLSPQAPEALPTGALLHLSLRGESWRALERHAAERLVSLTPEQASHGLFLRRAPVPEPVEKGSGAESLQGRLDHLYWRVDRKSTRLNSSHVRISYAVFCLKKKKKK